MLCFELLDQSFRIFGQQRAFFVRKAPVVRCSIAWCERRDARFAEEFLEALRPEYAKHAILTNHVNAPEYRVVAAGGLALDPIFLRDFNNGE